MASRGTGIALRPKAVFGRRVVPVTPAPPGGPCRVSPALWYTPGHAALIGRRGKPNAIRDADRGSGRWVISGVPPSDCSYNQDFKPSAPVTGFTASSPTVPEDLTSRGIVPEAGCEEAGGFELTEPLPPAATPESYCCACDARLPSRHNAMAAAKTLLRCM